MMVKQRNESYYDMLEQIEKLYPGKLFLKVNEAAQVMGCNVKTVRAAIEKRYNPLPAQNVGQGIQNKSYIIPIPAFVKWAIRAR